ncbi:MAG TPA: elongation factor P, partial [Candidatus Marinimicrobia bacterium]|nr:elongation factor P [Candidatus Neomarinimicrobiota bacterium]
MATTANIKNGAVILHKNKRMKIVEFLHVKPGKGPAFVRTKLKDIQSGKVIDETFNSGAKLQFIRIEAKAMQYLYEDGNQYIFMDNQTYEQINVNDAVIGSNT